MKYFSNRIKVQSQSGINRDVFKNEEGAIDLASIMVGIIVIGLIGGVIAATVFTVIPWSQDNAAKQQLDSVVSAESAYFGLSADNPPALPAGAKANTFGKSSELAAANLLQSGPRYCVTTPTDSKTYDAYSQSSSGKIYTVTDKNSKPVVFTGTLPTDCQFISDGVASAAPTPAAYVDPTPTTTILTYKCDTAKSGYIPLQSGLTGTETWNDGTPSNSYTNATNGITKTLNAGIEYKVTFEGTYKNFTHLGNSLASCLRSVDHWGLNTGVVSASSAFQGATNLVDVPDHIPTTITTMYQMFQGTNIFNDPDVSKWDVSNVTNFNGMFMQALIFNQPLNDWNVSKATDMKNMFQIAQKFNQPLNKWDVSKVLDMEYMFMNAKVFDQDLSMWNVISAKKPYQFADYSPIASKPAYLPKFK